MKKIMQILMSLLFMSALQAQMPLPFEDYHGSEDEVRPVPDNGLFPNGGDFTPKGDMRALVILVGIEGTESWECDNWPAGDSQTLPTNLDQFLCSDYNELQQLLNDPTKKNVSKYYHEMSKGSFRLMVEPYKYNGQIFRVNVSAAGANSFRQLGAKAIEKIKAMDPNFDWSRYDSRKNSPNYSFDNSIITTQNPPDKKLDYVIFKYRCNF